MPQITIDCPRCEGHGKIPLTFYLQCTLEKVAKEGAIAEDIAAKLKSTSSAISNRLVDLLLLGLVKRKREGKYWVYYPKNNGAKARRAK